MRRGMTLREALVLIFVVAVLLALLVPAISPCVGSARRAVCMNNQRQLCLAMLNFETKHKRFPGYKQKLASQDVGWGVMLLPYIGIPELWKKWEKGTPLKINLPLMSCPSDSPTTAGPEEGPCSYSVNGLICRDGNGLSATYIQSKDGCENTLLTSENLRADKVHNWWDTDPDRVCFTNGPMASNVGSNHTGGVIASFCDGSDRFLRTGIDDKVFKALVTPDGGEKLEDGDF